MRLRQIRRKQTIQLELDFAAITYHEIRNPLNGSERHSPHSVASISGLKERSRADEPSNYYLQRYQAE
eukprot:4804729-Pleurochrysis_carterae.AAC.1